MIAQLVIPYDILAGFLQVGQLAYPV